MFSKFLQVIYKYILGNLERPFKGQVDLPWHEDCTYRIEPAPHRILTLEVSALDAAKGKSNIREKKGLLIDSTISPFLNLKIFSGRERTFVCKLHWYQKFNSLVTSFFYSKL